MELYPEMNEKIKDILRVGGEPYLLYAAEYIERLEKERDLAVALSRGRNNNDKTLSVYDGIENTGRSNRSVRNPWLHRNGRHKMWKRILRTLE